MAAAISTQSYLILRRRLYSAMAQKVSQESAVSSPVVGATEKSVEKEVSWMKDPATGFWMPESHINSEQLDPVVLRAMLLPKKK